MSKEDRLEGKELKKALKGSVVEVGYLYPALKTPDGEIIAGKHRLEADPAWPVEIRADLDDPVKKAQVKLIENLIRRIVPDEEKTEMLAGLAKALIDAGFEGNIVKELTKRSNRSVRWVQDFLPEEYKDMTMIRKPDPKATMEEIIKLDLIKHVKLNEEERQKQGLTWRDIMKKHKVGSAKVGRLKKEVLAEITVPELLEAEIKHVKESDQVTVKKFEGLPGKGKSIEPIIFDEDPEPIGAGSQTVQDTLPEPEEESLIKGVTPQEIVYILALQESLTDFLQKWGTLDNPTTYGQGIAGTLQQLMKARPFEPYELEESEK